MCRLDVPMLILFSCTLFPLPFAKRTAINAYTASFNAGRLLSGYPQIAQTLLCIHPNLPCIRLFPGLTAEGTCRAGLNTLFTPAALISRRWFIRRQGSIGQNRPPPHALSPVRCYQQAAFPYPSQPGQAGRHFVVKKARSG